MSLSVIGLESEVNGGRSDEVEGSEWGGTGLGRIQW